MARSTRQNAKNAAQKRKAAADKIKKLKRAVRAEAALIAVIAVVFCVHLGFDAGAIKIPSTGKMTMGDYSSISIAEDDVAVTDDDVADYIETFRESLAEETSEGTVEDGDTVTINYTGYYEEDGEKGEAFDGGSDEDYSLEIGSDSFIDGFEDGLIGQSVGSTVDLYLTFPDDYDDEEMAGTDVIFEVEITSKTAVPDLTDELVAENSEAYWGEQVDTVADLETYVHDYYYEEAVKSALISALTELQTVKTYNSEYYDTLYDTSLETLEYYGSLYGYEADEMAEMYGYDSAEEYAADYAEYYTAQIMLYDYMYKHLGISSPSSDEIDESIEEYMEENGYDEDYDSVSDFSDAMGDDWYLTYTKITMRTDALYEALADNIVISDGTESGDASGDTAE